MSGRPHRNFAVKISLEQAPMCGAIWRHKIYWNKSHGCSSLQSSAQAFGEVGLGKAIGPQRTAKPLRVDAELGSSKAKLITLTQPENFRFQLAACSASHAAPTFTSKPRFR